MRRGPAYGIDRPYRRNDLPDLSRLAAFERRRIAGPPLVLPLCERLPRSPAGFVADRYLHSPGIKIAGSHPTTPAASRQRPHGRKCSAATNDQDEALAFYVDKPGFRDPAAAGNGWKMIQAPKTAKT